MKLKRKKNFWKQTSMVVASVLMINSTSGIVFAKQGSALDIGHPEFKNVELLNEVYTLEGNDYTTKSQLMKIYEEDLKNGSESFYIDRVLKRTGVANGAAGRNGNDDGNTFMTRGRALYMYTSNPAVIGFGGNTAYHQPFGMGDMYNVTFSNDAGSIKTVEQTQKRENMPSHWLSEYQLENTQVTAKVQKFINYENVAVTLITLVNNSDTNQEIRVNASSSFAKNESSVAIKTGEGKEAQLVELTGSVKTPSNLTTVTPRLCLKSQGSNDFVVEDKKLTSVVSVPANSSTQIIASMAFTTKEIPECEENYIRYLEMQDNESVLKTQKEEYNLWWAETMPFIDVPNKAIQKAIDYRWWLENFNKLDANIPGYDYQYPVTIEGVLGYNNAIILTQPMHLQDTKWMRDASLAYGQLLSAGNSSQSSAFLDNPGNRSNWNNHYGQYLATAGMEAFKVIGGNKELAENLAYYFEHDAKGQIDHYGNHTSDTTPENKLIDYYSAFMTGNDADTISFAYRGAGTWKTHAENAYVYGAADAAATMYEMIGDTEKAQEMKTLASEIQSDVLEYLWCEEDHAFETRAVAPSKDFVSHNENKPNLIPYMENNNFNYFSEGVVPTDDASVEKYGKMLEYLSYADEFPIFPYYTANQVDNKEQAGSNNFSNINFTVQARAYEAALRTYDKEQKYVTDDMFATMVEWCAWNMYPDGGDIRYPNNNEFFNIDGKDYSNYYRSWIYHNILGNYNYIFVEDVAGIVPREDDVLELDPIEFEYDHFMINNVKYHGKDITVVWDDPKDKTDYYGDIEDGFSVYENGTLLFNLNQKAHVLYENGTVTFPDGEPEGIVVKKGSTTTFPNAMETGFTDEVKKMLKKSGMEADITSENLAEGATVTASYTPETAREAAWADKHRSDLNGKDETSKAVNEEKPDPQAVTDGTTVNMPFWGNDKSPNASDFIELDLGSKKTFDMMNIYFYNDRQEGGYAEPARYTVEYWDGTDWKNMENQNREPSIPQANYNVNLFKEVTTDKVRITVYNKEKQGTAITEVQLYSEGGERPEVKNLKPVVSLSQDTTKLENMKARLKATCEDDGMPWDGQLTYQWQVIDKPENATAILSNPNSLETSLSGSVEGNYTIKFTANDGELSTEETITVAIQKAAVVGNEDIATKAKPASDYTASWENINGINNAEFEPGNSNPGTGKGWGNWQGNKPGESCWVSYTWDEKVEISGCDIYWYDDGGGTRVPESIAFQYKDENGEWKDAVMLTDFADANAINKYNTIALESLETTELRLNMVTQAAGTGILRFKVYSTPVNELLPIHIGTKTGVIPTLPESIYGLKQDGTLVKAKIDWSEITEEDVAKDGTVEISGVNTATGLFVTATIYVKSDMDKAGITTIDDVKVDVPAGKEVVLPEYVKVGYNNGAFDNVNVSVTWEDIKKEEYATIGEHRFQGVGTVEGTEIKATLIINVTAFTEDLEKAILQAGEYKEENYTKESWDVLVKALEHANHLLTNAESQEAIDLAVKELNNAMDNLQRAEQEAEQVLHLEMEPDASDIGAIKDSSKNGFHSQVADLPEDSWVEGIKGKAYQFKENNSFEIPAGAALATKDITISYWIKRTQELTGDNNILWAKKASTYNGNGFYINNPVNEGYSTFFVMDEFNGFYVNQNPNEFFPQDEWTHVAITWDSVTKKGAIYKNGVAQELTYNGTPNSITGEAEAANRVGENGYAGSGYPVGMVMDELSIYDNSLSQAQVNKIYEEIKDSSEPTGEPTKEPTAEPTKEPTAEPTKEPTAEPTKEPTAEPTKEPTAEPTKEPTAEPTKEPTAEPTKEPTAEPTKEPTAEPTKEPTAEPTKEPTAEPTKEPTSEPTKEPTAEPTKKPTAEPTINPTVPPIEIPTSEPVQPTSVPDQSTKEPTTPTVVPTQKPDNVAVEEDEKTKTETTTDVTKESDKTITETSVKTTDKKTGEITQTTIKKEETTAGNKKVDITRKETNYVVDAVVELDNKNEVTSSKITVTPSKAETNISDEKAEVIVAVSESIIKEVTELANKQLGTSITSEILPVEMVIPKTEVVKQINNNNINDVIISASVPNETSAYKVTNLILPSSIVNAAKDAYKNLKTEIKNETGDFIATWSFKNNVLSNTEAEIEDINLAVEAKQVSNVEKENIVKEIIGKDKNNTETKSILLSFGNEKELPVAATINIAVTKNSNAKAGDKLYLYAMNKETKMLEAVPNNTYKVSKAGNVAVNIIKGTDYVLLNKKPSLTVGVPLVNQVEVKVDGKEASSTTISGIGEQTTIELGVPSTIKQVTSFSKTLEHKAVTEAKVSYKSSNSKVATISSNGTITSKKAGKTTITTTITLKEGKKKTVKTVVTVK